MPIDDIVKLYRTRDKAPRSKKQLPRFDNVNANLNFLTIDDVIFRYIWNTRSS